MILVGILGFLLLFILLVNVALSGKKDKGDIVAGSEEEGLGVRLGKGETTLGDYVSGSGRRRIPSADEDEDGEEGEVPLFLAPEMYGGEEEERLLEQQQQLLAQQQQQRQQAASGGGGGSSAASEREEIIKNAIKSPLRKDGGYGGAGTGMVQTAGYQPLGVAQTYDPFGNPIMSPEEYMQNRLQAIGQAVQGVNGGYGNGAVAGSGGSQIQQVQDRNNGRYSDAGAYNPRNTEAGQGFEYLGDNILFPGTIIHAILVSRIDTDYPAPIHARVTENIYDSKTGKNLLIPQGTILQGNYSSSSVGVNKVQIAWESMVVNYAGVAYQVSLGGMAGVDKRGRAGVSGFLDDHYFEWLKAAGVVSLFTMLNSEITYQTRRQPNQQVRELMDTNQAIVGEFGNRMMERALDIQPTVKIANGTAVSVSVNTALALRVFPAIAPEGKYVRRGYSF